MIWLSALPPASVGGSAVAMLSVCRKRRPVAAPFDLRVERNALGDAVARFAVRRDELVEEAADLARVARDLASCPSCCCRAPPA